MEKYKLNLKDEDIVLIITGCINPEPNQLFLLLKDCDIRLKQYVESIIFYIEKSDFRNIVFCENSLYHYEYMDDLRKLAKKHMKRFEWLSFAGDREKVLVSGKGYGEGEIIEYAIRNSVLFKNIKSFAKVTGRLCISNINELIKDVTCDTNYFNRDIFRGHGIDTRFYITDLSFYNQYLKSAYKKTYIDNNYNVALEDIFYMIIKNKTYRNTYGYPYFKGISGGNGINYGEISDTFLKICNVLCKMNLFNIVYPFRLGWLKIKYLIKNSIDRISICQR